MSRRKHGTECVRGFSLQSKWVELDIHLLHSGPYQWS